MSNCIKQCCDASTNFGSINIDKTWTACPSLSFQYHCLSPFGPECDPDTGIPCENVGDCIQFSIAQCNGTSLYEFSCGGKTFWTNGSGSVGISFLYTLEFCAAIPEGCVQPIDGDGIEATFTVTVTKVGGGSVFLVASGVDNMSEVVTGTYTTISQTTGIGGVTFSLDFDDHSNGSNTNWKPCCQYNISISGGVQSVDNTGSFKDIAFTGIHGLLVTGGVTSDCCAASAACTEVD